MIAPRDSLLALHAPESLRKSTAGMRANVPMAIQNCLCRDLWRTYEYVWVHVLALVFLHLSPRTFEPDRGSEKSAGFKSNISSMPHASSFQCRLVLSSRRCRVAMTAASSSRRSQWSVVCLSLPPGSPPEHLSVSSRRSSPRNPPPLRGRRGRRTPALPPGCRATHCASRPPP